MQREPIVGADNPMNIVMKMSEGNPGAMTTLVEMLKAGSPFSLLDLDDMNIRGEQVWVAFKDHCGQDITKLITAARDRDPDMVATVNREVPQCKGGRAVTGGGSRRGD